MREERRNKEAYKKKTVDAETKTMVNGSYGWAICFQRRFHHHVLRFRMNSSSKVNYSLAISLYVVIFLPFILSTIETLIHSSVVVLIHRLQSRMHVKRIRNGRRLYKFLCLEESVSHTTYHTDEGEHQTHRFTLACSDSSG
ncbi:unnamed protein product [Brassica napus]|uniref:(rape) hypothetical protein n=1 Tax=Brassica napus TaxID=3708 RepID=A0A816J513_BRANA|nr:unnamed protein product [Brassica napus]